MYEQDTQEANGTSIIIPTNQYDKIRFSSAIHDQLGFCNVEVKNINYSNKFNIITEHPDYYLTESGEYPKLLVGKILYNINLDNTDLKDFRNLRSVYGLVIRCNIGDVKVTLSREDLEYTKKTIELLRNKLQVFKESIVEIYKAKINSLTTFREFNKYWRSIRNNVAIHNYDSGFINIDKLVDIEFNGYKPFNLIKKGYYNIIYNKIEAKTFYTSGKSLYGTSKLYYEITDNNPCYKLDTVLDKHLFNYHNCWTVKEPVIDFKPDAEYVDDLLAFTADIMKEIDDLPLLSVKRDEFVQWKKDQRKLNKVTNVRPEEEIPVSSYGTTSKSNWTSIYWERDTIKLKEDFDGLVLIGNTEDNDVLTTFLDAYYKLTNKEIEAYKVAVSNNKKFTQRGAIHIKDFMKKDHPILRDLVTRKILRDFIINNRIDNQINRHRYYLDKMHPYYKNILEKLYAYRNGYTMDNQGLLSELIDLAVSNGWVNRDYNLIEHYNNYMKGIELFKFIELTDESLPLVQKYLQENGKLQIQNKNQLKLQEA